MFLQCQWVQSLPSTNDLLCITCFLSIGHRRKVRHEHLGWRCAVIHETLQDLVHGQRRCTLAGPPCPLRDSVGLQRRLARAAQAACGVLDRRAVGIAEIPTHRIFLKYRWQVAALVGVRSKTPRHAARNKRHAARNKRRAPV